MNLAFISPRLSLQKGDFWGSGVPYWPLELAILAGFARANGDHVSVIDLFGSDVRSLTDAGDHYLQGSSIDDIRWNSILDSAEACIVYALSYMSHAELLYIIARLKARYPKKKCMVLENAQSVTAYSLEHTAEALFKTGADLIMCGEPFFHWKTAKQLLTGSATDLPPNAMIPGGSPPDRSKCGKLNHYPVPAWDLFPVKNYWSLPYAHGPKQKRFFPILTSRGCPYNCDFCVMPTTGARYWHGNDPEHVVAEMLELRDKFGVHDFHIEDVNPVVDGKRWEEICNLLVKKNANIRFYFVSGTKAETIAISKIPLFAKAGCRYVSISPESGSERLMAVIGKNFDQEHGLKVLAACRENGIRTQACLLVGHPCETEGDFRLSASYLKKMLRAGLDEIAVFIIAPFAGSFLFTSSALPLYNVDALVSFSPKGRKGYATIERRRRQLIRAFFLYKITSPGLWAQGIRSLFGTPQTKMENLPRRVLFIKRLQTCGK